jgi:hypothetical protein
MPAKTRVRKLPRKNIAEVEFTVASKPYHPNDCGHAETDYLFSFCRKVLTVSGDVREQEERYDVYFHETPEERELCLRSGTVGKYFTASYSSFLVPTLADRHRRWSSHEFVHDMVWLVRVCGLTPVRAAERLTTMARLPAEALH